MDASQYKDYVLTLLFMKYVSDKYADKTDALIEVPEGGGFAAMVTLKNNKDIGEGINKIIGKFAEANELQGVIDVANFNDEDKLGRGKDMVDRLSKLVGIFQSIDFGANRAEGDDLLGDAYEYLMRHFATESGKSKGQFYTPAEVSRIMAKVVGISSKTRQDQTIYDPTCGSGSLLLKAADESSRGITIYGQENDVATWALAKMNMYLHGHPTADLWRGNTLSAPYFKNKDGALKTFDFALANPPFSMKAWANGFDPLHDEYRRFAYGVPPAKNGDYAFLLHFIASLKSAGKGTIILPHGVLFRGNKEGDIRKNLVTRGLIKGIIGLPANLFYGTGIPACIIVIDKENAQVRTGIFMIDASKGFMKDGNKNRLRARDIHRIVDVFNRQAEWPGYSRMVPTSEIASPANDYNLNIPRYIDSGEKEDLQDLDAHMRGGIPDSDIDALATYWSVLPSLRSKLVQPGDRAGYSRARVDSQQVKGTILADAEFIAFADRGFEVYDSWKDAHHAGLNGIKKGALPKEIIEAIAEDLLKRFDTLPLLDKYRVYQRLMDYWVETMQDDIYLVAAEGWIDAAKPRPTLDDKERKIKETPDLVIGKKKYRMDLLPPRLVSARFFPNDLRTIAALEVRAASAEQEFTEFVDENASEDGPLEEAKNDKGEITKAGLGVAIRTYDGLADSESERALLARCAKLFEVSAAAAKAVRDEQSRLDSKVLARYGELADEEIRSLVVDDKWFAELRSALADEIQRLSHGLAGRITELEMRYAETLPELTRTAAEMEASVLGDLHRMGVEW
ncbi:MAG: type I restriction-modification system subunit M [Candidatus Dormibacteraeota bacterium]|nr:type I restriction-modification system subunit M [Candidatus Dormibacteraeota bacterium]